MRLTLFSISAKAPTCQQQLYGFPQTGTTVFYYSKPKSIDCPGEASPVVPGMLGQAWSSMYSPPTGK